LEKWFDFESSPYENVSVMSLKEDAVTFDGLIKIMEANGIEIDGDI
jgi:hypothetical protein